MIMGYDFSEENKDELSALGRMVQRSIGRFNLAFAQCNSPAEREILMLRLKQNLDRLGIPFDEIVLQINQAILPQLEVIDQSESSGPLFIYGLEKLIPNGFRELNEKRGRFHLFQRVLVFWLPEYALEQLARQALDFWSWRSGVFRFSSEKMAIEAYIDQINQGNLWQDANLPIKEKLSLKNLLQSILNDYQMDNDVERTARASTLYRLAFLEESLGNLKDALKLYQELLEITEKNNDLQGKADALHQIAGINAKNGDSNLALNLYQQSLEIKEGLGDLQGKADTLHQIAGIYVTYGNLDDALNLYQNAIEIFENSNDIKGKSNTLHQMARISAIRGELDEAIRLYNESFNIKEELNDHQGKADTLHQIAGIHMMRGDLDKALELYHQSLNTSEALGDLHSKAAALHQIAGLYVMQKKVDEAMILYKQSLEISEKVGDQQGKAATLHQLANICMTNGDLDGAMKLYQQSLEIFDMINDQKSKAAALANIGILLFRKDEHLKSLNSLITSLSILKQIGVKRDIYVVNALLLQFAEMIGKEKFQDLWQQITKSNQISS